MLKVYYYNHCEILPNSLFFAGQTCVDLALLHNKKLVAFFDFQKEISDLFGQYETVYYKAHPYSHDSCQSLDFLKQFRNVMVVNHNTYAMLSHPNLSAVASLSSGVLHEAKYFDKEIIPVSHLYNSYYTAGEPYDRDTYVNVTDKITSPQFWHNILKHVLDVKPASYPGLSICHNRFRHLLNIWWGYEIDKPVNYSPDIESVRAETANMNNAISPEIERLRIKLQTAFSEWNVTRDELDKLKIPFRTLRRLLACFVPSKKLRRKIRGDK
jgi:hypothetical protein